MEAASTEGGAVAESVVIESDKGDNKGNNKNTYAAFKAVKVEDEVIKEAT